MTRYVIVSGGPSVVGLDIGALYEEHSNAWLVAVNRAWYRAPGLFHVWSAGEAPGRMWATVAGYRKGLPSTTHTAWLLGKHHPVVWCPEHYAPEWLALGPMMATGRRLEVVEHEAAQRTSPGWETNATYLDGSLTQTLAWAFRSRPERVDVYGADLAGTDGYGVDVPAAPVTGSMVEGLATYSPEWWARRWRNERAALETAIREAAEHGIEVVWHREAFHVEHA